jgi:hypothetical protein
VTPLEAIADGDLDLAEALLEEFELRYVEALGAGRLEEAA